MELIPKLCANLKKEESEADVPYLDLGECGDKITLCDRADHVEG